MKGLFIPEITAEMFRNGCLESIEALMAEGEIYDIEYSPWIPVSKQLPDKYGSYLIMWRPLAEPLKEGYPDRLFYEICEYEPEEDEWERIEQAGEAGAEIIAWMPLPERYKEGGAE